MPQPSYHTRVLTTKGAHVRHATMKQSIGACPSLADADWQFFHAIPHEATNLVYNGADAIRKGGRTLSPAELSCYASHCEIVRQFVEETDFDYLLVCEDDIFIDPNFNFVDAFKMMKVADIDYLRLYARSIVSANLVLYSGRFQVFHFPWSPGGTQAYVLSREGAKRLTLHMQRIGQILRPIDDEMDRAWTIGNPIYALHPWPVLEYNTQTIVHADDQLAIRMAEEKAILSAAAKPGIGERVETIIGKLRDRGARKSFNRTEQSKFGALATNIRTFFRSSEFSGFRH